MNPRSTLHVGPTTSLPRPQLIRLLPPCVNLIIYDHNSIDDALSQLPYWAWFAFPGAQYQLVLDTSYMIPGTNGPPVLVVEGTASAPINITGSPIPVYIRPTANSGKCLTAASNTNGAAVEIEDCVADGSTSQEWTNTGTTLQIFGNKCLDVTNGATADGTKLQIWTCNTGNTNQEWVTFGSSIQWSPSSCLDLTNGVQTDGNLVRILRSGLPFFIVFVHAPSRRLGTNMDLHRWAEPTMDADK